MGSPQGVMPKAALKWFMFFALNLNGIVGPATRNVATGNMIKADRLRSNIKKAFLFNHITSFTVSEKLGYFLPK